MNHRNEEHTPRIKGGCNHSKEHTVPVPRAGAGADARGRSVSRRLRDRRSRSVALAQRACLLAVLLAWFAAALVAQVPDVFPDVTAISLEDLMNLKVTSVSKRAQKLADAPAAIF